MAGNLPDVGDVHVDKLLTTVSWGYMNSSYVADSIFPIIYVDKQSDIIPKYTKSYWFRNEVQERAPGTIGARAGYAVDTSNKYFCVNYAIGKIIPDEVRLNADQPFDMDRDATEWVTDQMARKREIAFATNFMKTGVWGTDVTGGSSFTKWSDYANSDPIGDIRDGIRTILQRIGRRPNVLLVGEIVWNALQDHPDIVERVKYTQMGVVTSDLVKAILELENIYIAEAIYASSPEGTAEANVTYSPIIDDDALLIYVAPRPGLFLPSAGYTFIWRPAVGAGPQFIRRIRKEEEKADVIEAQSYFDQKVLATDAGYFFSDAAD